jgi:hypothetical protein
LHVDAATTHKSPSQFLIATKTRATIANPHMYAIMTFSASTLERESALHDINSQQSFEALHVKPNDQRKT